MPVQSLQTVENAMVVLEKVAENQPIGVSALARLLDMDKNTAQRLLVTLGRQGWISQDGPKDRGPSPDGSSKSPLECHGAWPNALGRS